MDVKPEGFVRRDEVRRVFAWTERLCVSRGWSYEVWTGADSVVLANLRTIGAARRKWLIDPATVAAVEPIAVSGINARQSTRSPDGGRCCRLRGPFVSGLANTPAPRWGATG
ncbi:conserved hypothetical protein (plasmid) [Rhodococcus jostii RHA1]|uniref:Uncharacterized protein n=1 Tax=Rhodococcus jostii (strain RHA1) TaxID=101510 RepID=Q0RZ57_RHOJR|nr:conserved hypothetical protein [Rhodococcus jostii RHA1]